MAGCAAGPTFGVSASHRGKPMDFLDTGGILSPWVFPMSGLFISVSRPSILFTSSIIRNIEYTPSAK